MRITGFGRRGMLAGGTALAASGLIRPPEARAGAQLNLVLESEVVILDPYMTTAAITRTFGFHVFDTLFAMDGAGPHPAADGRGPTRRRPTGSPGASRLRAGAEFHDGRP